MAGGEGMTSRRKGENGGVYHLSAKPLLNSNKGVEKGYPSAPTWTLTEWNKSGDINSKKEVRGLKGGKTFKLTQI